MDFNRILKWTDRARNLHEFLGDLLEGERELVSDPHANRVPDFSVRDSIDQLLIESSSARDGKQKSFSKEFARLAPYFEAGFYFDVKKLEHAQLNSMFLFGQTFAASATYAGRSNRDPSQALKLPRSEFGGVLRGRVRPLLRAFRLEGLAHLEDADVFALSVRRGELVLLVCNRPHPWQVEMLERAHEFLSRSA